MPKILIKAASHYKNQDISLSGWVNNYRSSGKIYFIELRDGSGYMQTVFEVTPELKPILDQLSQESAITVTGTVTEHPKKKGIFELQGKAITIVGGSKDYPIAKKEHGVEFLMANRHLWLRSKKQWAALRVRDTLIRGCYDFLHQEYFIKIDSPIITPVACEGTTTLFGIDYFDLGKGYLSQSGQLYLEAAIAAHGRVYDFGPVFRAEKSNTRKHLTEFWMLDAEMAFCEHEENMQLQERFICSLVEKVLNECQEELSILERDVTRLEKIKGPFPRMTHSEAIKFLQKNGSEIKDREDLGANDESILGAHFDRPIFIEKWPHEIKAFYMKRDTNSPDLVLGSDLIAPDGYGEIIGGSQREDDYEVLLGRMKEEKMPISDFDWYLDTRRYGSVPHAGFGIGLERMVCWMTGVPHIRESIPFPRTLGRIRP